MDDGVIDNHIALFVNENSLSLSSAARLAIRTLTGVE
jgi:predicted solute-binding protein